MLRGEIISYDNRRNLFVGKDEKEAVDFASQHFIHSAEQAIQQRGKFTVALSGGSTPKAIYETLPFAKGVDWSKVFLFWSDERAVPPSHPDSNYRMAMESFKKLPIPAHHIFRMEAEGENIVQKAKDYEEKIHHNVGKHLFDLVMLGVGTDGHTASLFPGTKALDEEDRLVVGNHVAILKTWRMTFTYPCINQSAKIAIYAIGASKRDIVPKVLTAPIQSPYPSSKIGTAERPVLWVLDQTSAAGVILP